MSPGSFAGSRALVTGGAGFIGARLCSRLRAVGAEVHATSRRSQSAGDEVRWLVSDLADINAARSAVKASRPDVIFHLASRVEGARDLALVESTRRDTLIGTIYRPT